jgi:ACS family hexuronate transporter-like MFS transporter
MGLLDFIWLWLWIAFYRRPEEHPHVSPAELAYILSDPAESHTPVRWGRLVVYRQMWAFAIGKFLTDPIWWLYLFWLPDFLDRTFRVELRQMALPLVFIYSAATAGSICGGWFSSALIKRGWSINRARKAAMLGFALAVVPIIAAAHASHLWMAVALVGLATAAHQGWSANIFTLSSDMFPRHAVASVVGIGGMAGALGGILLAKTVGYILQWTGSYFPVFAIAASAYLAALLVIQLLAPKLEPVRLGTV